jgi:hypothetical protein
VKAQFITWPLLGAGAMAAGIALVKTARRPPGVNRVIVTGSTGAPLLSLTSLGLGPLRGGAGAGVGFSF